MKPLILIADDHPETCEVTTEWLEHHGYEIAVAHDGRTALRLADELHPALVLLDIMMPELDGIEVARSLKHNAKTRGTPIVVMTASGRREHEDLVDAVGCDGLVKKPVDLKALLVRIEALLARKAK